MRICCILSLGTLQGTCTKLTCQSSLATLDLLLGSHAHARSCCCNYLPCWTC